MRASWRKNFRTKDGRKVALTGCSRSSETQAQWTDVRTAADREVPARMKTLTTCTKSLMVLSQEDQPRTHSTVCEISRGTGIPKSSVRDIIKKHLQLLQEATYGIAEFAGLENDGVEHEETYILRWSERKLMCTTRNYFTHKSKYISYVYCLRDLEQQCDRQHKLQHWNTWSTACGHCMISFLIIFLISITLNAV